MSVNHLAIRIGKECRLPAARFPLSPEDDSPHRDFLWAQDGWLEVSDRSRKSRAYRLADKYRQFIGTIKVISIRNTHNPSDAHLVVSTKSAIPPST